MKYAIWFLIPLLISCSHTVTKKQQLQVDFEENQTKWKINRVMFPYYKMKVFTQSPTIHDYSIIDMKASSDDHVYAYKVYDYETPLLDYTLPTQQLFTIDFVFQHLGNAIKKNAGSVTAEYNAIYGYPEKVYFKYYDDYEEKELEYTIKISEFRPTR